MLVISRQRDEAIMIGEKIEVTVVDIRGDKVRLGVVTPPDVSVHRKEVYDAIRRETSAARAVQQHLAPQPPPAAPPAPPPSAPAVAVRLATPKDLPAINDIYNHYVLRSTCTYQEEPATMEERSAWFKEHGPQHPITVATEFGEVVGWGSLSKFHRRSAYGKTVEDSVYVRHDLHRRGIGRALLADLVGRAKDLGHHSIMALVDRDQSGSIAIHRSFGFTAVGHLREVGHKFGRWLDVVYMQKML